MFEAPPPNATIWRYCDLPKLVMLLSTGRLWFSRADVLGDPHEGALPEMMVRARDYMIGMTEAQVGRPWVVAPGLDSPADAARITVRSTFVSCWNLSRLENYSLWAVYGKGVAIKSTYGALRDSFLRTPETVYIGRVRYIDYRKDSFPDGNAYWPLVHKRRYFENERELRAAIPGRHNAFDDDNDGFEWAGDPREGIGAEVDLAQLIREVRVAPGEHLLREAVQAVLDFFALGVTAQQSSLDDPPRF